MDLFQKLEILTGAAKYDVACTSSGVDRGNKVGSLGTAVACGICHSFASDGRCISLLKVLMTNHCMYDCKYCHNRASNDVPRAAFTPEEIADITISFYKRNYIEGLFLSSAVVRSPDHTMEMLYKTLWLVREKYKFNGYIHVKGIPGADKALIYRTGLLADRMSINIELPSQESLARLCPEKEKSDILSPMKFLQNNIEQSKNELVVYKNAPIFVPGGQSTQMIIGATPESDKKIISLSEGLYKNYKLKRVFFSAYNPVGADEYIPKVNPPLLREHRLYQVDWLMRFYGFTGSELFENGNENLSLNMDPKCRWAIDNIAKFPVEASTADYMELMRVPGIGMKGARKIMETRRVSKLTYENLKKMGIVLKRAKYFITVNGKMHDYVKDMFYPEILEMKLSENKISDKYAQLSVFDQPIDSEKELFLSDSQHNMPPMPTAEDELKCLTGEL